MYPNLDIIKSYIIHIILTSDVTSNECIAGNGQIPERSDTGEYIKNDIKGSVSLQYGGWLGERESSVVEVLGDLHSSVLAVGEPKWDNYQFPK